MYMHKWFFTGLMGLLLFAFVAVCGGVTNVAYADDVTPPVMVAVSPVDGATDVSLNGSILATFSEPMKHLKIRNRTFTLTGFGLPVSGRVDYIDTSGILNPKYDLLPNTVYTATVTTEATDIAGNPLASDFVWSFTTGTSMDTTPPTVNFVLPADGATNVALNTSIIATFSESMDPKQLRKGFMLKYGKKKVKGTLSYVDKTAIFKPRELLAPGTLYTATIKVKARDLAKNYITSDYVWSFRTGTDADTTAPTVILTNPADTDTGVATNTSITATFSEAMNNLTINTANFTLTDGINPVDGTVVYDPITHIATFDPISSLVVATDYTATITTGATDIAGNPLASDYVWSFTTGEGPDTTAPTVIFTDPADTDTGVATNTSIAATFSEAMNSLTIIPTNFTLTDGINPVDGTVVYDPINHIAIFDPISSLVVATDYTATITTGATDLAGNPLASDYVWSFTTGAGPDTTAPTVIFTDPAAAATGVALNTSIAATFSEAMNSLTIIPANFTLTDGVNPVDGTVVYDPITHIAIFDPISSLVVDTDYTATITTGATDLAGNPLAGDYVWSFSTGAGPDVTAPTVSFTDPAAAATGVAVNTSITVTFSEAMAPLTITTPPALTLMQGLTPVSGAVTYIGRTAIFNPISSLNPSAEYTATVAAAATDLAGNPLASDYVWSFTTGAALDTTTPTVSFTNPADTDTGVALNTSITATFSEAMDPLSITTPLTFTLMQGLTPVPGAVTCVGKTAIFNPISDLAADTVYTATITTGATDLAGNPLASDYVWSFTTGAALDTTAPTVTLVYPGDLDTGVAINTAVNATFDSDMDPLTINTANFTLTDGVNPVAGTVSYDALNKIATFVPLSNLATLTTYTATVTTGVEDLAGNAMASDKIWIFTTRDTVPLTNEDSIALGAATNFAILATDSVSGVAGNTINGDVGLSPGTAVTIAPSEINGNIYTALDPVVLAAKASLLAAYNDATSRVLNEIALPTNLTGLTLYPGLYVNATSTGITTGTLTLDAQGDTNAVFIFKTPSLTTGTSTTIVLSGGAQAKNIYWQVFSSATLGVTSIFKGTVLADISVSVLNGAVVDGRLFAGSGPGGAGSVVVNTCTVTVPAQ